MKQANDGNGKTVRLQWWQWLLLIDLVLVIVTVCNRYLPAIGNNPLFAGDGGWRILEPFNLIRENNPAAWWSAACLLAAGLLAAELFARRETPASAWLVLAFILIGLSADEIMSIHERIDTYGVKIPLATLGCLFLLYVLVKLYRRPGTRRTAALVALGFVLFGTVAVLEFLEHTLKWPLWLRGLRAGVEEGLELMGELLILSGLVRVRSFTGKGALRDVIPNPSLIPKLLVWMGAAFLIHATASVFWTPRLDDLSIRGNPSSWYPSAILFVLFCWSFWQNLDPERGSWRALSVLFFMGSIDIVTVSSRYLIVVFPRLVDTLPEHLFISLCHLGYIFGILAIFLFSLRLPGFLQVKTITCMGLTALLTCAGLAVTELRIRNTVSGAVALALAAVFLVLLAPEKKRDAQPNEAAKT